MVWSKLIQSRTRAESRLARPDIRSGMTSIALSRTTEDGARHESCGHGSLGSPYLIYA